MRPALVRALGFALIALPLIAVALYALPLPMVRPKVDQWILVDFFARIDAGTAGFSDFTAWVNATHRSVVPRAILAALAFATNWSLRAEVATSIVLAAIGLIALVRVARSADPDQSPSKAIAIGALLSAVVFSFSQEWNWTSGYSLNLFCVNTFVCLALVALAPLCAVAPLSEVAPPVAREDGAGRSSERSRALLTRIVVAALCCVLASFSMVHGLLSWVVLLPLVSTLGARFGARGRLTTVWLVMTAAVWAAYFWVGPSRFGAGLELGRILADPLALVTYYLELLGAPWGYGIARTMDLSSSSLVLPGLLAGALFIALAVSALRSAATRHRGLAWISLGSFALLYAAANALGRGLSQVAVREQGASETWRLLSMYSTHTSLLVLAVIGLAALQTSPRWRRGVGRAVLAAAGAILVANLLAGAAQTIGERETLVTHLRVDALCLELYEYMDRPSTCRLSYHRKSLAVLDQLGFREARRGLRFDVRKDREPGELEEVRKHPAEAAELPTYEFRGTLSRIFATQAGAAVLIRSQQEELFLGLTVPEPPAPGAESDVWSWSVRVPQNTTPERWWAEAWVYNTRNDRFVKLKRLIRVKKSDPS